MKIQQNLTYLSLSLLIGSSVISAGMAAEPGRMLASVSKSGAQGAMIHTGMPNESYLRDTREVRYSDEAEFFNNLIQPQMASELRQEYLDRTRNYELKAQFGLVDQFSEQAHSDTINDFGLYAFGQVRSVQVEQQTKYLREEAAREFNLENAHGSMKIAMALVAIYGGAPLRWGDEQFGIHARTHGPSQTGRFSLLTPILEGRVELNGKANPTETPHPTADPANERYRFVVSRALPVFNLMSDLSYGGSSSVLTASLSKELMDNLTCTVGHSQNTRNQWLPNEESLRLNYRIHF